MKRSILIINILFLAASLLFSQQQVLTYEDAINLAVKQNITIKQQKNQLKVSQAEKQQSMASFLPNLNASGGGYITDGRQWSDVASSLVNTSIDRASYSINTDMTVFNGFKNVYQLKQTNQLCNAQKEQVKQSIQDVILQTSQQYLQVLLDKELLNVVKEDYEVQNELYKQLEAYVKTGTRTKTELLSQEALLKTSEATLVRQQNQLRSDKVGLAKILFFDPSKEFDVISPNWTIDSILIIQYVPDSLLQLAIENRSDIKRLQAEGEAYLQGVRVSRTGYIPNVSVYYRYGSNYASDNTRVGVIIPFEEQLLAENYYSQYGFTISIPIFSRLQNRTNVVQSKITYENSILEYMNSEMQLFLDVQNAYQDFLSYKESYLANVTSANASQKAYEKQLEMYRLGQGSLVELNLENQRNIQAQSEKIQAEYTLLFQQVVLDYYCGILK